jgi:hypothetical protein
MHTLTFFPIKVNLSEANDDDDVEDEEEGAGEV